jgi:hypothetical protein
MTTVIKLHFPQGKMGISVLLFCLRNKTDFEFLAPNPYSSGTGHIHQHHHGMSGHSSAPSWHEWAFEVPGIGKYSPSSKFYTYRTLAFQVKLIPSKSGQKITFAYTRVSY